MLIGSSARRWSRRWSYAAAKSLDEAFAHAYWRECGLQVAIARLFKTVGHDASPARYGMVVPNLVRQALRGESLTVFGDGTDRPAASPTSAISCQHWCDARREHRSARGHAFNLGGAQEISILALAHANHQTQWSLTSAIEFVPYAMAYGEGYADMRRRVPSTIPKQLQTLGFSPDTALGRNNSRSRYGAHGEGRCRKLSALLAVALPAASGCGIQIRTPSANHLTTNHERVSFGIGLAAPRVSPILPSVSR